LDGLRGERIRKRPGDSDSDPVRYAGKRLEMVGACDRFGEKSGEWDAQRFGNGSVPAEVRDEAEVAVSVGSRVSETKACGDVSREDLALALRVLRSRRAGRMAA
jgi:hypothetical protein